MLGGLVSTVSTRHKILFGCIAGEASVEDVFCQNFIAGVPGIGETLTVPLNDDDEDVMVTEDNRREFVDLYVDYYLNTAIHKQVSIILLLPNTQP